MKRTLFVLVLLVIFGLSINAQDYKTAIGARLTYPWGVSLKHFVGKENALEGIVGLGFQGVAVTGLFERERWTGHYPGLNWFWGFGAHVGFWDNNPQVNTSSGVLGVDAIIGLEYTFDEFPINLSLDLLPSLNLINTVGWNPSIGGFSIRYVF